MQMLKKISFKSLSCLKAPWLAEITKKEDVLNPILSEIMGRIEMGFNLNECT